MPHTTELDQRPSTNPAHQIPASSLWGWTEAMEVTDGGPSASLAVHRGSSLGALCLVDSHGPSNFQWQLEP